MNILRLNIILVCMVFCSFVCFAQTNSTVVEGSTNKQINKNKVPIVVDYRHADTLGRVLGLRLEEKISLSPLFYLAKKKEKGFCITIKCKNEFNTSPSLRSVCSIVWSFYYGEDMLNSFLSQDVEIVDSSNIEITAQDILAITNNIVQDYNYLLQ